MQIVDSNCSEPIKKYRRLAAILPVIVHALQKNCQVILTFMIVSGMSEFVQRRDRATKHGKKWTEDKQSPLKEIFAGGSPTKEIVPQLGRGENGVRSSYEPGFIE